MIRIVVLFLTLCATTVYGIEANVPKLRVLYCGNPDTEREADFLTFLRDSGFEVGTSDLRSFVESESDDYDVTVFDWTYRYDGNGGPDPSKWKVEIKQVSENFRRPAILVSAMGLDVTKQLKVSRLCLCMSNHVYQPRVDHEVFHQTLEVEPTMVQIPTPWDAKYMSISDSTLGEQISVWEVQTKDYPEIDPGLACDLYGFDDSPDCEILSQGISDKGLDSLAIGRQANFLFWGFSAAPDGMTPSGRKLFTNAIVYIAKFDGSKPLVKKLAPSRLWALRYAQTPLHFSEEYKSGLEQHFRDTFAEHPDWIPMEFEGNAEKYLLQLAKRQQKFSHESMASLFPADVIERCGDSASAYRSYYETNLDYLRFENDMFVVDEEVKPLGIPNNDPSLIEKCIAMLGSGLESDEKLARAILKRYCLLEFETKEQWAQWYSANRERIYFSDTGGFKFYVSPARETSDK